MVTSSGAEAVRDAGDYLAFVAGDDETRAIVLFLETVRRPVVLPASSRGLRRRGQARTLPHGRPFGRRAPGRASHTGASVGSDRAFSALLRTTGAQRADDFHEFVETLEVLGRGRRPRGGRIGGISESGGECALLADHAELVGIPFAPMPEPLARQLALEFPNYGSPQNPLDAWAVGEPMSDRVAVMNAGHVEQIGTPAEVYEDPPTVFVADFLGVSNVIEADGVSGDAQSCMVRVGEFTLRGGCGDLGARGR